MRELPMKNNEQLEQPNREHAGYRVLLAMTSCLALWVALFTFIALPRLGQAESGGPGKELFEKRCSGCHALDKDKEGPRLRGVFGRTSGTVPSFQYSDALKVAHISWDATTLDKWLAGPEQLVPDSDMAFQLVKADERAEVIAYLKQLSSK
jgi:cytochrome c